MNDFSPVIGSWKPASMEPVLRAIDEVELADAIAGSPSTRNETVFANRRFLSRSWLHTAHAFGHIGIRSGDVSAPLPIRHAGDVAADPTLRGAAVTISLDRLRVADYPGRGGHHVLFTFRADHHASDGEEVCHFSLAQRVREGEQAAVLGYPIFTGLRVGGEGISFRCYTVNVKNDDDEALIACLDSAMFQRGLALGSVLHPAVGLLGEMSVGLTKALAQRRNNVPVQDFHLGLGFSGVSTRAALAEGSYVAVQIPETDELAWDWGEWRFYPATGQIAHREDKTMLLPYNYIVLGVSRSADG
ncbi:hypothetical protein [Nocardia sp. NPDC049526]|uniref:hypothetical protein n=1 Tax=Nocardia sp. NPDC049526 TaxID=3364316 RepID=UPI0037997651